MTMKDGARQTLNMREIPQHQVPEHVRKRLLKKSQQVISAVNKGTGEFDEHLTQAGPPIISERPSIEEETESGVHY